MGIFRPKKENEEEMMSVNPHQQSIFSNTELLKRLKEGKVTKSDLFFTIDED